MIGQRRSVGRAVEQSTVWRSDQHLREDHRLHRPSHRDQATKPLTNNTTTTSPTTTTPTDLALGARQRTSRVDELHERREFRAAAALTPAKRAAEPHSQNNCPARASHPNSAPPVVAVGQRVLRQCELHTFRRLIDLPMHACVCVCVCDIIARS